MVNFLFPGQQETEQVYLVTRPHWFVFAIQVFFWLVFVAVLFAVDYFGTTQFPILLQTPYVQYVNLFKSIYLMFLVAGLFFIWILYYLNYQIITNERIVDVTQENLLHHTTSELHLSRIEDVTAEVKGLFGNLLNYGNIYVQTAGETERFQFDNIPNPHAVQKLILDLFEKLPAQEKANQ